MKEFICSPKIRPKTKVILQTKCFIDYIQMQKNQSI